jgi:FAD/FMN-containing dehydrogenase
MTVQRLHAALTGELLLPDSPGYDAARVRRVRQRYDPQRRFHPDAERGGVIS